MDVKHRELLALNCQYLIELFELNEDLQRLLLLRKVFTLPMLEDILSKGTEKAKKQEMILELRTRGPSAFQKFLNILNDTGQSEAVALLKDKTPNSFKKQEREFRKHSGNEGPMQLSIRTAKELKGGQKIFKMTSKPRGKCLIINNIDFNGILKYRCGSEKDGMKLDAIFNQLDYDVKLKSDLEADKMKILLEKFAGDPAHQELDSCVVVILSHGNSGIIYGVDGEKIHTESIFSMFNNENCPSLRGKPKVFFIQACRGTDYDSGVDADESTDAVVMPIPSKPKSRMPTYSDMLIAYSTVDGYVSIRDQTFGTWFCQELVDALVEDACDTDLETILKRVDENVQQRISSSGDKQSTEIIRRGWNKTLFFNPGLYSSSIMEDT